MQTSGEVGSHQQSYPVVDPARYNHLTRQEMSTSLIVV